MSNHEHEGCCGNHDKNEGGCSGGHTHDHDHEHGGCGCHGEEDYKIIQLSLEDGSEVDAAVLEVFEVDGKSYIALLPIEEESVLLYAFKEDEEGIELTNIETEEEFEAVSEAFYKIMEFDEEDEE